MAEPILITCSACQKQLKVPRAAVGKKVRCKKCKALNAVPASAGGPVTFEDEVVDAKNPYIVTETSLAPRCPFCANDIDPPDARICLNCGYDLEQRERREHKIVMERSGGDFIGYHLPTLGAFLGIALVVGGALYYHYWLPFNVLNSKDATSIRESRWNYFDDDQAGWMGVIFHWGIEIWGIVIGLFMIWKCLVVLYKRLIVQFLPDERIQRALK